MKDKALPWPTSILRDVVKRLGEQGRLAPGVDAASVQKLAGWLQFNAGPMREWCRATSPRTLAACALVVASRQQLEASGGNGSLIVKDAAQEALTPATVAAAAGASDNGSAVSAALLALP